MHPVVEVGVAQCPPRTPRGWEDQRRGCSGCRHCAKCLCWAPVKAWDPARLGSELAVCL